MLALFLPMAMLIGGAGELFQSSRPLVIPSLAPASRAAAEIRLSTDGEIFPVATGIQLRVQIRGDMTIPATDPGRTLIQVELVQPLLARNGRTVLLPAGTRLAGLVHLLRGEFRFVDFQSLLLPDGRSIGLPEALFRLGPGPLLAIQDGTPALLTLARPLRMEPFGPPR